MGSDSETKTFETPKKQPKNDSVESVTINVASPNKEPPLDGTSPENVKGARSRTVSITTDRQVPLGTSHNQDEPLSPLSSQFSMDVSSQPADQIVAWAKTLQSPTLPAFSPSVETTKSSVSYHGTGLFLSINRGHQLNKTTRRCVTVLQELGNLYDQYAVALSKAGQMIPGPTAALITTSAEAGLVEPLPLLALQQSMGSWAKDKSKVARHVRSAISGLLQTYLATHHDSLAAIQQRYTQCRSTCSFARGRALRSHKKYMKAIKDSEQLIAELEKGKGRTAPATDEDNAPDVTSNNTENKTDAQSTSTAPTGGTKNTTAKGPKRLEARLKDTLKKARQYENRYKDRVKWENDCVQACQRLETMGLESLQKMEEDRLAIFVNTVIKVMSAQKQALDAGVMSLSRDIGETVEETEQNGEATEESTAGKKSARKFVKMLTESKNSFLAEEESTGAMDAETLGLPSEVGDLRDGVRARLARRKERILLAKNLSLFFESVIKASTKLGQSLRQLLKKETANSTETLHVAMASCEGAHVLRLWDGLASFLEAEADGCFAMADSLRNVRAAKLDSVILYGEKAMKVTGESDDVAWKNLCETARAQAKAETRYRQCSVDSARARERMASLDNGQQPLEDEKDNKDKIFSGKRMEKRMQKGLASIASLLPNAGDHASKMLGPEARATVAQKVLKDASEKESKEKQQLVAAVEAASAALTVYKSDAEHVIARYDEEEAQGWQDIQSSIESFAELAQKLLGALQLESISDLKPIVAKSRVGMVTDINEWRMKAQQELVAICVDCNVADDSADSGFCLQPMLHGSEAVDSYMESTEAAVEAEKSDENDYVSDEELEDEDTEEIAQDIAPEVAEQEEPSNGDAHVKNLFKRPVFPPNAQKRPQRQTKRSKHRDTAGTPDHDDPETDLFLTYFWPDPADPKNVPVVVNSFSCSFRDGAQALPSQYGRAYLSGPRIVFTSWTKKKLNLKWEEVKGIKGVPSFNDQGDEGIQIICKRTDASEDSCMILDGFEQRQSALDTMEDLRVKAIEAAEAQMLAEAASKEEPIIEPGGVVPPDTVIKDMNVVVSKHLRGISIQKFHETVWSEKVKPLFRPWVEKEAFDVEMGDWKEGEYEGPWCKEKYDFERTIKFRVKRKTHLYIGPPIANVIQVHRCRVVDNDKCIVSMTIEFEGIPYSDTFAVEVRWVALREGANDIKIECGLVVDFKKKTFLKSKIQSGTLEESTPVHKSFFQQMQSACVAAGGVQATEEVEEPVVAKPKKSGYQMVLETVQDNQQYIHIAAIIGSLFLILLWRIFFSQKAPAPANHTEIELVLSRVDELEAKLDLLQQTINDLVETLQEKSS